MRRIPRLRSKDIKTKSLFEGKGVIYELIGESEKSIETALKMAKRNRKLKDMIPDLIKALDAIRSIK